MSLINDALKQARKTPPRSTPTALPPLPSADDHRPFLPAWVLPSLVLLLIFAAIFFVGWAVARHNMQAITGSADAALSNAQSPSLTVPVVKAPAAEPAPAPRQPDLPKLQGIFYSATAPSAILDGKTVRPGDLFRDYRVKAISKYTVTLVGPDKKEIQLGMGN